MEVTQITYHCAARICLTQTATLIPFKYGANKTKPVREVIKNSQREVEADTRADGSLYKEKPLLQLPEPLTHYGLSAFIRPECMAL